MSEICRVGIVGGGLIGSLCALKLTEPGNPNSLVGRTVTIFDRGDPRRTAAYTAGAFVNPDWSANLSVCRWQQDSWRFYGKAAQDPEAGVMFGPINVLRRQPRELGPNEWCLTANELLPGFLYGTAFNSYRINPPKFLGWMRKELERRGVQFVQQEIRSFEEVKQQCGARVIVNGTGVGARLLADDPTVVPYREHCARIHLPNAPQVVRLAALEQTWCVPVAPDEVRVGGTSDEGCWDLTPDPDALGAMFIRVKEIMPPELHFFDPWGKGVIEVTCGLRPGRPKVRLEVEDRSDDISVVHCYGHGRRGGEGFTLGPGCASEVCIKVLWELEEYSSD